MSGNKKKTVANIIEGVIIAVMIALIGGMLFLYFSFGEKGAAPNVLGYTIYHTRASNMEPRIPAGTVIFAKESEIDNIKTGSVVLCRIGENTVLTRVVTLVNENGVMSYVVRFDTDDEADTYKIPRENIIAKAVQQDKHLGGLLDFATSTKGIMMVIIIPSFIIIVFQIIRIVNVKRVEEDAYSLEDLDEIMLNHDDDDEDSFFDEPETKQPDPVPPAKKEAEAVVRIVRDNSTESAVRFEGETARQVLSVDKNGKAALKFTEVDKSQLFTYDKLEIGGRSEPEQSAAVKAEEQGSAKRESSSGFMSNVLPERIAEIGNVGYSMQQETPKAAKKPSSVAVKVKEDRTQAAAEAIPSAATETPAAATTTPAAAATPTEAAAAIAIPEKAVVPKEKLAPPPKKSNGRTISELMSIIDAEESKLR